MDLDFYVRVHTCEKRVTGKPISRICYPCIEKQRIGVDL